MLAPALPGDGCPDRTTDPAPSVLDRISHGP
jgi:hypothetical protein